jgi:hypothetical protein
MVLILCNGDLPALLLTAQAGSLLFGVATPNLNFLLTKEGGIFGASRRVTFFVERGMTVETESS